MVSQAKVLRAYQLEGKWLRVKSSDVQKASEKTREVEARPGATVVLDLAEI